MTVCTNHLALCHLVEDALPIAVSYPLGNAELLVPEMVELEDHRVALSAIDAGMFAKKRDEILDAFGRHDLLPLPRLVDIPPTIGQVVLSLIQGPARAAIVVPLPSRFPPPGEILEWFLSMATPATPHGGTPYRHEQTFAYSR
jgi:hypothetical protein